jgi:hypothetical protein
VCQVQPARPRCVISGGSVESCLDQRSTLDLIASRRVPELGGIGDSPPGEAQRAGYARVSTRQQGLLLELDAPERPAACASSARGGANI